MTATVSSRLLLGTAVAAGLGFVALARAVARGQTQAWDNRVKRAIHVARSRAGEPLVTAAARSTSPLGKWWGYIPPALLSAERLRGEGRHAAARTLTGTALSAALLPLALDRWCKKRFPPPERREPGKQSFPSGHALQTSAMALTTFIILRREGLGNAAARAPLAPLSVLTGVSRLLLDRHWASDVLGGYLAGIALGATSAGIYELTR